MRTHFRGGLLSKFYGIIQIELVDVILKQLINVNVFFNDVFVGVAVVALKDPLCYHETLKSSVAFLSAVESH